MAKTFQYGLAKRNPAFVHQKSRYLMPDGCLPDDAALRPTQVVNSKSEFPLTWQPEAESSYSSCSENLYCKFKAYPLGYFHIDMAQVQTAKGRFYLFVAIDRTSKFAFVRLVQAAEKMEAAPFLCELRQAVSYTIHTILTDHGIQFAHRKTDKYAPEHAFDRVCRESGIKHRLTLVNLEKIHPAGCAVGFFARLVASFFGHSP